MNFGTVMKAFDALVALRDVTKRFKGEAPKGAAAPETGLAQTAAAQGLAGQIETRLTNVLVAALKEAFDRDHARLELERSQLDEERRRAEQALKLEQRRQATDRELGRLRLLAATAMIGWITSVLLLGVRMATASPAARAALIAGWLLLLGALGTAFSAMGRAADEEKPSDLPMWLLIAGLAVTAVTLLL